MPVTTVTLMSESQEKAEQVKTATKIMLVAILLGLLSWVTEGLADYHDFRGGRGSIWNSLIFISLNELFNRGFVLLAFIIFGLLMAIISTRRIRAEGALRASEILLRQFVEYTPAAVAMFDREVRYLWYSKRWLTDYKLGDKDITGKSHYEVFPDIPDRWKEVHQRVLAGDVERCEEDAFERADGSVEWVRWEVRPWWNNAGQVGGIIMFTEVITERKRTEEALRAKTEELDLFFGIALDLLCIADTDGNFRLVNPAWEQTLGYKREDLQGRRFLDFVHPDDLLPTLKAIADLSKGQVIIDFTNRYRCSDGSYRWLEWRSIPYQKRLICSAARDITQRKQEEEERRQFYRETIRSVTQGKLNLVSYDEVADYLDAAELMVSIASAADTASARHQIREFCASQGLHNDRLELFESAVGEAITNAVKHASKGRVYAGLRSEFVWVAVSDDGPGISTLTLPSATLRRGFSTKTSMGMGYSIMMEASDNILLCTGAQGTTVVLSISTAPYESAVSLDDLPDTWDTSLGVS